MLSLDTDDGLDWWAQLILGATQQTDPSGWMSAAQHSKHRFPSRGRGPSWRPCASSRHERTLILGVEVSAVHSATW